MLTNAPGGLAQYAVIVSVSCTAVDDLCMPPGLRA
jgi:hypothetical protein